MSPGCGRAVGHLQVHRGEAHAGRDEHAEEHTVAVKEPGGPGGRRSTRGEPETEGINLGAQGTAHVLMVVKRSMTAVTPIQTARQPRKESQT